MIAEKRENKLNKKSEWQKVLTGHQRRKEKEPTFLTTQMLPEDAEYLLEENDHNRHMQTRVVDRYKRFMKAGKWRLNGECIKISTDGILLDGQHRLEALRQLGKPVRMSLAIGVAPDTFAINDTGKPRSSGDILSIAGYKNVNANAAALRFLLWYRDSEVFSSRIDICPDDILTAIKRWPHITYFVYPSIEFKTLMPSSIVQFFMYITQTIDSEKSYLFFQKLLTGEGLKKKSGILQLRNMLLKYKISNLSMDKRHHVACLVLAWNAFIEDRPAKTIKWNGKSFPAITGIDRDLLFKKNSGFSANHFDES